MKKYLLDFTVFDNVHLNKHYILLKVICKESLSEIKAGQFVEIRIDDTPGVMLRRPISVNYVDEENNIIWLLVQLVGKGTYHLSKLKKGDKVNILFPLGNSFTIPDSLNTKKSLLLIGGGAGTAPMLFLGSQLHKQGFTPIFLLGAKTAEDVLQRDDFARFGEVCISTEDGSLGEKGFVTTHSILLNSPFDYIYACGPKPMMMAVANYAKRYNITCEVSLENKMACGLGACLCCVENTREGNLCVCKEGPVFNINDLLWQD